MTNSTDQSNDALARLLAAAQRALQPPPRLTVSEWADQNRLLSSTESGEPGPWRTDRVPYLREIMDRLSVYDPTETVVLMKGAQIAGTEAGLCWLGYVIEHAPAPIMIVQPTVETAKRFSKQRVSNLTGSMPQVKDPRARDSGNTVLAKEFPGGILIMTGANSAVGLRSMPVRDLMLDEVDGYPPDVDNEGDPIALAKKRTATFARRKIFMPSTPTIKGESRIEAAYAESDQRRFFVPCPFCEHMQTLEWSGVRWPPGEPGQAAYYCESCGSAIEDWQKSAMLSRGEWRPQNPNADPQIKGYHLSSLYSPHGWRSWGAIAKAFVKAHKDPVRLKTWTNTELGETWDLEDGERISGDDLIERRESWGDTIPAQVGVLTAGVDVQDDRLEMEVTGWGRGEESWSVAYHVLWGDPSTRQVWQDLDELLLQPLTRADGHEMMIEAAAVDTGGHHTLSAYAFCRGKQRRRVWAIKGKAGSRSIWPRQPSRSNKGRVPLFIVGVDEAKEQVYARLKIADPGPGFCHFPLERDPGYFEQLTAETIETKYHKGHRKRTWVLPSGKRNEALDCRAYAIAALHGWYAAGKTIERALDGRQRRRHSKTTPAKPAPRRQPQGSWLRRRKHWI